MMQQTALITECKYCLATEWNEGSLTDLSERNYKMINEEAGYIEKIRTQQPQENPMITEKDFSFSQPELVALFWAQYWSMKAETGSSKVGMISSALRSRDKNAEIAIRTKELKKEWLQNWANKTRELLKIENEMTKQNVRDFLNYQSFPNGKLIAFVAECSSFIPYYPLDKKDNKKFKSLIFDDDSYLGELSTMIPKYATKLAKCRKLFIQAQTAIAKDISGKSNALLYVTLTAIAAFLIAPPLGSAIGGLMGLSGAAATSAGLALLGFGSIAAGGLGMAGGTIMVVAAGSIVAYGSSGVLYKNKVKEQSKEILLVSCAKMAAVLSLVDINKSVVTYFCNAARILQHDLEKDTDEFYIDNKKAKAKEAEYKSSTLIAFRKFIRAL